MPSGAVLDGDAALWRRLHSLLTSTYDVASLEGAVGIRPLSLISVQQLAHCRVLLEGDPSCTAAVELFLLGTGMEAPRAAAGLAPLGLERLARAGLLELDGDLVRAKVSIVPFHGLWLVADRLNERGAPSGQRVPSTDLSSLLVASVVSHDPVRTMLDLGTGTGVHALLAARHAASVVGVDINPRALTYARFNAGLNSVANAQWVAGDFFDGLDGRAFDLVVANPPFIIAPDRDDVHRFGGGAGHELSRRVLRGAAARLHAGGRAYVLCDVGVAANQTWTAVLRECVAGTGCDALLLRVSEVTAGAYALSNNDASSHPTSGSYERASRHWLDSYRSLGISTIASALVVLRRRTAPENWVESFVLAGNPVGEVGAQVDGLLAGLDRCRSLQPQDLLALRLALVEGHHLFQRLDRGPDAYRPAEVQVRFPGFPLIGSLSPEGLAVVVALDGTQELHAVIAAVAATYGLPEHDLLGLLLPQLHELMRRGFLRVSQSAP